MAYTKRLKEFHQSDQLDILKSSSEDSNLIDTVQEILKISENTGGASTIMDKVISIATLISN